MTDLDLAAIRQRVHGINNGSHPVRFLEARDDLGQVVHAECEGNTESDPLATNTPVCERCWITKPCDCEDER